LAATLRKKILNGSSSESIATDVSVDGEEMVKFWKSPDQSPDMDQIRLGRGMRSPSLNGKPGKISGGHDRRGMSKYRLAG